MDLNQAAFSPHINQSIELNGLEAPVVLSFIHFEKGAAEHWDAEIQTCMGDIYKIINMLYDYANLLETAVAQWGLEGFHKGAYEIHAAECRRIAEKYSAAIGYDYKKAVETCRKRTSEKKQDDGVGEDAMVLAVRGSPQKKDKKRPDQSGNQKKDTEGSK